MGAYISTFPTGFAGLIPAAQEMGFPLRQQYDTLVNGKKAAVYLLEVGPAL